MAIRALLVRMSQMRGEPAHDTLGRPVPRSTDFLPAALEIEETPPSRTARALVWTLATLICAAVIWGYLGHVDMVAVAEGKVVPSERVKVIQALATAEVKAIHVRDGQRVRSGDVLVELDPTTAEADSTRWKAELTAAESALSRETTFLAFLRDPTGSPYQVQQAKLLTKDATLLTERTREYSSELRSLDQAIARRRAELDSIRETLTQHEKTLPLISERARSMQQLVDRKLVSRTAYLEIEEQRIRAEQETAIQRANAVAVKAALAETLAQRDQFMSRRVRETLSQMADLEVQVLALRQERVKAGAVEDQQRLVSPVDGVVQQLAVHTIGGVVTPAAPLMVVVPESNALEIEAHVLNKDVGWVQTGQPARIKLEAFPFTRHGVIAGEVLDISGDAIPDERRGLVYAARIRMAAREIQAGARLVPVSPGMAVAVEIRTGSRRLIDYFLSPIRQHVDQSLAER